MRNQEANPVYGPYKHLLAPSGRYPAKHVDIFSNKKESRGEFLVRDVEVVFVPREALKDPKLRAAYAAYNKRWSGDLGNSAADWLKPEGMSPGEVFGYYLRLGFVSDQELLGALEEFAHIEECQWAREMLKGFKNP